MKAYFVFDAETNYILSGYDCCTDDRNDGYNIFTRPYSCPQYHPKNERCRLDYIYNKAKREGLKNLKYSNLRVAAINCPYAVKSEFIKNPDYFYSREAARGWWKLTDTNYELIQ